mgnify:CR=1 FL=1
MIKTTLCYIEKEGSYLMLLRNKKEKDLNEGKWVGIGGKFEPGESADECLLREVREETGLTLTQYKFHGIIRFVSDKWEDEDMYLYSADRFEGELKESCSEGELCWIPGEKIMDLDLWEGDPYFLRKLLAGEEHISMTLEYKGDKLTQVSDFCS